MKQPTQLLILLFPLTWFAEESTYLCTTKPILALSENGTMEAHEGMYNQLVDKQFSIHRESG